MQTHSYSYNVNFQESTFVSCYTDYTCDSSLFAYTDNDNFHHIATRLHRRLNRSTHFISWSSAAQYARKMAASDKQSGTVLLLVTNPLVMWLLRVTNFSNIYHAWTYVFKLQNALRKNDFNFVYTNSLKMTR